MEALALVGLSSNILQFVDFSCQLFERVKTISESATGSAQDVKNLENITKQFQSLCANLTESRQIVQGQTVAMQPSKDLLVKLAHDCEAEAADLLDTLEKLKSKDPNSWRSNVKAAFKTTWRASRVKDMQIRLQSYRAQLMLHLQVMRSNEWVHIAALLDKVGRENRQHDIHITTQLAQLTLDVQNAVNLWSQVQQEHAVQSTNIMSVHVTQKDDEKGSLPDVASLIWRELSNNPVTIALSLLNSLSFYGMGYRQSEIKEAHPNTFDWAFENPFQTWLSSSEPVYWISGKPGSGKSTLMKFLVDNPNTPSMVSSWSGSKNLVISSYFFWINGTPLQRSQEGLLRALLYDILRQCPALAKAILPDRYKRLKVSIMNRTSLELDWPRGVLLNAFKLLSLCSQAIDTKFFLFIDGLDEYKANSKHSLDDLIKVIQYLTNLDVKICVASRPWNEFEEAFGKHPEYKLYLQEFNKPDIRLFVADHLEARPEFKTLRAKNAAKAIEICNEIVEKAQGVFLWVYLVVHSLVDGLRNYDRITQLEERLRAFPSDLDGFFRHIFATLEPVYRMETAHMFQVALAAYSPLSPIAYWFMDEAQEKPGLAMSMPIKEIPIEELEAIIIQTNARLNGRCKGLLEISPPVRGYHDQYRDQYRIQYHDKYHVDFLHRTVRDFFMTNDILQVFANEQETNFDANMTICKAILAEHKSLPSVMLADRSFLQDHLRCFFHAAKCLEHENGASPIECLDELDRTITHHSQTAFHRPRRIWERHGFICFMGAIAVEDLELYMAEKIGSYTQDMKYGFIHDTLMSLRDSVKVDMIATILSNGPAITFDLSLQDSLGSKLGSSPGEYASAVVNLVLKHSSFTGPAYSMTRPIASASLWRVLMDKLSDEDLDRIRKPPPVFKRPKPQRRSFQSVFKRLLH